MYPSHLKEGLDHEAWPILRPGGRRAPGDRARMGNPDNHDRAVDVEAAGSGSIPLRGLAPGKTAWPRGSPAGGSRAGSSPIPSPGVPEEQGTPAEVLFLPAGKGVPPHRNRGKNHVHWTYSRVPVLWRTG